MIISGITRHPVIALALALMSFGCRQPSGSAEPPLPNSEVQRALARKDIASFLSAVQTADALLISRDDVVVSDRVLGGRQSASSGKSDVPMDRIRKVTNLDSIRAFAAVLSSIEVSSYGSCGCSQLITIRFVSKGKTLASLGIIQGNVIRTSDSADIWVANPEKLKKWLHDQEITI